MHARVSPDIETDRQVMAAKFPFDQTQLPQISTRKALILVDFQNDFTSPDGALPVPEPDDFVNNAVQLSGSFRSAGEVIWVSSLFKESRQLQHEQLVLGNDEATDVPQGQSDPAESLQLGSRGLRNLAKPSSDAANGANDQSPDEEAFLSQATPACVKPSTTGSQPSPAVQAAIAKRDVSLSKSHYSAFRNTNLLHTLRARLVMEVFICGSLLNVGVYATALDAAGHGMSITIVEDCCGYRHEARQRLAVKKLIELTGCEVASAAEVMESIHPPGSKPVSVTTSAGENAQLSTGKVDGPSEKKQANLRMSKSPDIVNPMTSLRLASNSPNPGTISSDDSSRDLAHGAAATSPENGDSNKAPVRTQSKDQANAKVTETSPASTRNDKTTLSPTPEERAKVANTTLLVTNTRKDGATMDVPSRTIPADPSDDQEEECLAQTKLCSGDSDVIEDVLPSHLEEGVFEKLVNEVKWQRMSHQGGEVPRLVAVQGDIGEDGSIPVYRHPSDESPPLRSFTDTVLAIKLATEQHLGHQLNHVLIQFYRDGKDYISEHSDKTLDIVKNSYIANVSLGAERTMTLRTKRRDKDFSQPPEEDSSSDLTRRVHRARLPHNSLFRMGLKTNEEWLHSIRQDKRADREKSTAELAFGGGRISLTFRWIGTFLDERGSMIWGQGATGKTKEEAHPVINGQTAEAINLLKAFSVENRTTRFDWNAQYGKGFDVLHMSNAPRLFSSNDPLANMRVALMLAESGINFAKGNVVPPAETEAAKGGNGSNARALMKLVDTDEAKSVVQGDIAIMLYLEACHGNNGDKSHLHLANRFTCFQQALELADGWSRLNDGDDGDKKRNDWVSKNLSQWEDRLSDQPFLTGEEPTLADYSFWPVLHTIVERQSESAIQGLDRLRRYYDNFGGRDSVRKITGKPMLMGVVSS